MTNVAWKRSHSEATYEVAVVVAVVGAELIVRGGGGETSAERATSCLVPPKEGDEVAVVTTGDGRAFVIAILARAEGEPVDIAVDGDLRIRAGGTMSLTSKVMNLRAAEGSVVLSKLTLLASSLIANADNVQVAAKTFDAFCERLSQTVKRCFRKVEELDHLRAGRIDYRTEQEMCLRSENFVVGARQLAKIDAEQIHIG